MATVLTLIQERLFRYDGRVITCVCTQLEGVFLRGAWLMMALTGASMYTFLLLRCVLALTLCPLLLDAILTRKYERQSFGVTSPKRRAARLTLAETRAH